MCEIERIETTTEEIQDALLNVQELLRKMEWYSEQNMKGTNIGLEISEFERAFEGLKTHIDENLNEPIQYKILLLKATHLRNTIMDSKCFRKISR